MKEHATAGVMLSMKNCFGPTPRDVTYRVPRTVVDLEPAAPGLLVAGTNPVKTDAVSMAPMGFDPMADRGARDLSRIEAAGAFIAGAGFDFAGMRKCRRSSPAPAIGIRE